MAVSRAVRLPDEVDRRLVDHADESGRTMSDIMREALEQYFGVKMRLHQMDVPEAGPPAITPLTRGNADSLDDKNRPRIRGVRPDVTIYDEDPRDVPVRSSQEAREVPDRPTGVAKMGSARRCQCPREVPARDLRCGVCGLLI